MAGPMRIRATTTDGVTEVKVLMTHPMETGLRKNPDGSLVPAHHITEVTAMLNDKVVLEAQWGPAVSQNPFVAFRFKGGKAGDKVTVSWKDNLGETQSGDTTLA